MNNKYTTILIGNGLGMSLDPDYFRIEQGLIYAWNKLDSEQQNRIKNLITNKKDLTTEEQLNNHYEVIQACLMLSRIEEHSNLEWLVTDARKFPNNFRNFIVNTALYFFEYEPTDYTKLNGFLENLKKFIVKNDTHLATLNYDKLIYDRFSTDKDLMRSSSGRLVDGFLVNTTGFTPSVLWDASGGVGCYMHLHGSPLFYSNYETGIINKSKFSEYQKDILNISLFQDHLILCASTLKKTQIIQSPLLRSYWDFFKRGLDKSERIIIFGYSGNDLHVNEEIYRSHVGKEIIIVEHLDGMSKSQRKSYWERQLKLSYDFNDKNLILLQSILDFDFNQVTAGGC